MLNLQLIALLRNFKCPTILPHLTCVQRKGGENLWQAVMAVFLVVLDVSRPVAYMTFRSQHIPIRELLHYRITVRGVTDGESQSRQHAGVRIRGYSSKFLPPNDTRKASKCSWNYMTQSLTIAVSWCVPTLFSEKQQHNHSNMRVCLLWYSKVPVEDLSECKTAKTYPCLQNCISINVLHAVATCKNKAVNTIDVKHTNCMQSLLDPLSHFFHPLYTIIRL